MRESASWRHEPQPITDAARSVAMVSLLGGHHIATASANADEDEEEKKNTPRLLQEGAGVVVDLTETRGRSVLDRASTRCSTTVGVPSRGEGAGSWPLVWRADDGA